MNWNAVGVISAIAIAGLAWFGNGAQEFRTVADRVRTLETQRIEDLRRDEQRRADDAVWRERLENKVDRLLERREVPR